MRPSGWHRFGWYVWDQGPGLPGDWQGRLAPSHAFIFHFNRAPRKPHKTVPSKHAGPWRRRDAPGRRHRPRQDRHWQQGPKPPHPRPGVPHHAPQRRAGCCRIASGCLSSGADRGGAGDFLRTGRPGLRALLQLRYPAGRRRTRWAVLLRDGVGPGLWRCGGSKVGDGNRQKGGNGCRLTKQSGATIACDTDSSAVRCAEKPPCRAEMMRVHSPIRPTPGISPTTDTARGEKHLFTGPIRAILL